jgi:GEVED domain/Secretion system C-terminal sorting domain
MILARRLLQGHERVPNCSIFFQPVRLCLLLLLVCCTFTHQLQAQITDIRNCGTSCNANDVQIDEVFVGDGNMMPLDVTCNPGDQVTGFLWITVSNGSNGYRGAIRIGADVFEDSIDTGNDVITCTDGPIPSGNSLTFNAGSFSYTCGALVELRNLIIAWRTQNGATCANSTNCNDYPNGQCYGPVLVTIAERDCGLTIQCPNSPTIQYDCNNAIPAAVTTEAAFEALGAAIGDNPCGEVVILSETDAVLPCTTTNIVRTYTVFDDLSPFNGTLDQGETSFECVINYSFSPDDNDPSLTCPDNVTVNCSNDVPAPDTDELTQVSDDCDTQVELSFVSDVTVNQVCDNQYEITRTYQAKDNCNNTKTCTQVITVYDEIAPLLTCPDNITVSCANLVPPSNPGALNAPDNCGGEVTVDEGIDVITGQICANRYTLTRRYLASDDCGNSTQCVQVITVNDQTPPELTCPLDVTVSCANQVPQSNVFSVTVTDNCGGSISSVTAQTDQISNQTCANRFIITRVYRALDLCGNSGSCSQIITVNDQTPPFSFNCPANTTVSCASNVPQPSTYSVSVSDNCGGTVSGPIFVGDNISNQTCANRYTITRVYKVEDECGNSATCSQTITVNDQTPPTLTCPNGTTVSCASAVPAANINLVTGLSDNCGGMITVIPLTDQISNQTCANRYTITRRYQASDVCGNSATCTQIITVNDQTPPMLTCPDDVTVSCAGEVPLSDINSVTGESDNCGGTVTVTVSPDQINGQTCANRYTIGRTYKAQDVCGNFNFCTQLIVVNDQTPPSLTCSSNLTVSCASEVPASNTNSVTGLSDNCTGTITVNFVADNISDQTCANRFIITRFYQVIDECGNSVNCSQSITVNDQTPPDITCPASITVECGDDIPNDPPTFSDNCGGDISILPASSIVLGDCPVKELITRSFRATDVCGNSATCDYTVTVIDTRPPVFDLPLPPANTFVECGDPLPEIPEPTAEDRCDGDIEPVFTQSIYNDPLGCILNYTINYRWVATDECGNSAEITAAVDVVDSTPPEILNVPPDVTAACGDLETFLPDPGPYALDICGKATIYDFFENTMCMNGLLFKTRTWRARDQCGNTSEASQNLVASDTEPPVPMGVPDDITINEGEPLPPGPGTNTYYVWGCDDCHLYRTVQVFYREEEDDDQILRIYEFCDCIGNCASDTQRITIIPLVGLKFINIPTIDPLGIPCETAFATMGQVKAVDGDIAALVPIAIADSFAYDHCSNNYTLFCNYTATTPDGRSIEMVLSTLVLNDGCEPIYCEQATADASQQWIAKVQVKDFVQNSVASTYSDFTQQSIVLSAGGSYMLALEPGVANTAAQYQWIAWIDLNRDGIFADDATERLDLGVTDGIIGGTLQLPVNMRAGNTRLRIAMIDPVSSADGCQSPSTGEIEDYDLEIKGPACPPTACTVTHLPQSSTGEYISLVKIGTQINVSEAASYSDFRPNVTFDVNKANTYFVRASASTGGFPYLGKHYWKLYVDFNRDGDFNDLNELAATAAGKSAHATLPVSVPADAIPGLTTMRVVLSRMPNSTACNLEHLGEVEDYALRIAPTATDSLYYFAPEDTEQRNGNSKMETSSLNWDIVPNPASENCYLQVENNEPQNVDFRLYDLQGRLLRQQSYTLDKGIQSMKVELNGLSEGVYRAVLQDTQGVSARQLVVTRQ